MANEARSEVLAVQLSANISVGFIYVCVKNRYIRQALYGGK